MILLNLLTKSPSSSIIPSLLINLYIAPSFVCQHIYCLYLGSSFITNFTIFDHSHLNYRSPQIISWLCSESTAASDLRAVELMREFGDSEAIEISRCSIGSGIIEMEESGPGTLLRPILHLLFVEIDHNFFDKEFTI
jgi:hypothetical protein